MRYWVCQSCKNGFVDTDDMPTVCENCGEVGVRWKSSDVSNMGSFKLYLCQECEIGLVEERQPPTYPCDMCGACNWKIFHGYDNF